MLVKQICIKRCISFDRIRTNGAALNEEASSVVVVVVRTACVVITVPLDVHSQYPNVKGVLAIDSGLGIESLPSFRASHCPGWFESVRYQRLWLFC